LYEWARIGLPASKVDSQNSGWRWDEHAQAALMNCGGDVTATRAYLLQDPDYNINLPGERRMQQRVAIDITPDQIALNKKGTAAAKQLRLMLKLESSERNELWLSDHKQLDVWVIPTRGTKAVKPWFTVIMDSKSRRVLGAAVSIRPSQAHVLAALSMAIATAGVPRTFVFDRGMEFTADAVISVASELGFAAVPTRAYTPNHKGKVERVAQTLGRRTVRFLAHRTTQAVDLRGAPRLTILDPDGNPVEGMPLDDLIPFFFTALDAYNAAPHSALGRSPNGAYREENATVPQRTVARPDLRRFLLKEDRRVIREHGVQFRNHWYYAEQIDGYRGTKVEIRYRQDDLTQLELYKSDGTWWCTADLADPASPATRERLLAHRRQRATHQAKITRKARRMARRNYAAIVSVGDQVRETTVISNEQAEHEMRGHTSDRTKHLLRRMGLDTDNDAANS
jgi:transposase InsO family protein